MDFKEMESILSVFKFADLQTFVTILIVLDRNDKEIKDLIEFVDEAKRRVLPSTLFREGACGDRITKQKLQHPCPKCDIQMRMFRVNTCSANQIGGGYKIQWICPKCDEEEFE